MKRKIIIVDCNAQIVGIQKALIALLKKIHQEYDITLLLLHKNGVLLSEIPENIRVITTNSDFKYMGMAQSDCKTNKQRIRRGLYVFISRYLGRKWAVRLALASIDRSHQEAYDVAIAYSHIAGENSFYGGAPEYVLQAVQARKKYAIFIVITLTPVIVVTTVIGFIRSMIRLFVFQNQPKGILSQHCRNLKIEPMLY